MLMAKPPVEHKQDAIRSALGMFNGVAGHKRQFHSAELNGSIDDNPVVPFVDGDTDQIHPRVYEQLGVTQHPRRLEIFLWASRDLSARRRRETLTNRGRTQVASQSDHR